MQVFVSDLHLTDGTIGVSVPDGELVHRLLEPLEQRSKTESIDLVLLGDIFELLRSTEWEALWVAPHYIAPWTSMSVDFTNFPPAAKECSVRILKKIVSRYPEFSKRLKSLIEQGNVRTHFVPGNHDFMVQLSEEARSIVSDFLSLRRVDVHQKFETHYANEEAEVFAVHGNRADPLNWHDGPTGQWAFGDAIVLRLVNSFITEACRSSGSEPVGGTPIVRALQDLDNVEPSEDLGLYFRFILERELTNEKQRGEVLEFWRDAVNQILTLEEFSDRLYADRSHRFMKEALELSKDSELATLAVKLYKKYQQLFGTEDLYLAEAQRLFNTLEG
ncbi:MAG TPA: hypothetical protein VEU96_31395, partial [Bryobacteraceae bacterium]|nr:hypothetical protein [Bryobacteraceae bacterium]